MKATQNALETVMRAYNRQLEQQTRATERSKNFERKVQLTMLKIGAATYWQQMTLGTATERT